MSSKLIQVTVILYFAFIFFAHVAIASKTVMTYVTIIIFLFKFNFNIVQLTLNYYLFYFVDRTSTLVRRRQAKFTRTSQLGYKSKGTCTNHSKHIILI